MQTIGRKRGENEKELESLIVNGTSGDGEDNVCAEELECDGKMRESRSIVSEFRLKRQCDPVCPGQSTQYTR